MNKWMLEHMWRGCWYSFYFVKMVKNLLTGKKNSSWTCPLFSSLAVVVLAKSLIMVSHNNFYCLRFGLSAFPSRLCTPQTVSSATMIIPGTHRCSLNVCQIGEWMSLPNGQMNYLLNSKSEHLVWYICLMESSGNF